MVKKAVFDTNVWLDFFMNRKGHSSVIAKLLQEAQNERLVIYTSALATKDLFYLLCLMLKRMAWEKDGELTEPMVNSINEIGWSCLKTARRLSVIAPVGGGDVNQAFVYQTGIGLDFEDNLMLATAHSAKADYFVTYDKKLLSQHEVPITTPEQLAKTLGLE